MITEAEATRIVEAIRTAETRTTGEIFCVIAHASSSYRLVPVAWAAMLALAVPLPLIYATRWPVSVIYLAQLAAFIVTVFVLSLGVLRFRIVPKRTLHHRAHTEAVRQFLAHGLHLTEQRTGVLIFASVAERYAEIIADAGINDKVTPAVWQDAVDILIASIREGRAGDGFIAAIQKCQIVLAQHFPPGAINRDELPNKLVVM